MTLLVHDDFTASAGVLDGRTALTGQTWADTNDALRLDGSGRLIRNPAKEGVTVGSYAYIDAGATPVHQYADMSFSGTSSVITENGAVVLISGAASARAGNPPTQGIFHNAIHAVFGLWQTVVTVWEGDAAVSPNALSYTYPGGALATDGTIYRIGIYIDGQRLGVQMPDGALKWVGDARVATYTGRYLIYQTYNDTAPNLRPRMEEVWADNDPATFGSTVGRSLPWV